MEKNNEFKNTLILKVNKEIFSEIANRLDHELWKMLREEYYNETIAQLDVDINIELKTQ